MITQVPQLSGTDALAVSEGSTYTGEDVLGTGPSGWYLSETSSPRYTAGMEALASNWSRNNLDPNRTTAGVRGNSGYPRAVSISLRTLNLIVV